MGQAMLFQLDNVTKTYGRVTALDNLSVGARGAVGLLGPNGSGKTTMIRTLLGLITIDRGDGHILDMDIRRQQLDIRRDVGFAPEDECLFPARRRGRFRCLRRRTRRHVPRRRLAARPRSARLRRPGRGALPQGRHLLDRHETAPQAGVGHRPRPEAPHPRRADQRHGPGRPRRGPASWPATCRTTRG